jgi:hypothetical protein
MKKKSKVKAPKLSARQACREIVNLMRFNGLTPDYLKETEEYAILCGSGVLRVWRLAIEGAK